MRNFKDRISTIVDRKKITFEDNQGERFAIVEFADEATELGTDINRTNMMGVQGYVNSDITFNPDGSITTIYPNNVIETTIFNDDGSIKQEYNLDGEIKNKFTYFDEDGSITETFTERPYIDKNTLLLLHGDSLTDSSIYNVPITNNGVTVSTAQSKFGGSSLYFNGGSKIRMNMSDLQLDFNDNWTLEWWDRPDTGNSTGSATFRMPYNGSYGFCAYALSGDNVRVFAGNNNWTLIPVTIIGTYKGQVWTHRALCKQGNVVYCFENGSLTAEIPINQEFINAEFMYIGMRNVSSSSGGYIGYLDEIRVSNIARWTSDFTPPTEPYDINQRP